MFCVLAKETSRIDSTVAVTQKPSRPRRVLRLGCGVQGGRTQAQAPSRVGPSRQGWPGRLQTQVVPLRRGRHSLASWHWPLASGPWGQGRPSAA